MGTSCNGQFKSRKVGYYFAVLLTCFVAIGESRIYYSASGENEFDDEYLDEGTLQEIKHAVYAASESYSKSTAPAAEDVYVYPDYDTDGTSIERKPVKESYDKYSKHPVILKPSKTATKVHKSQPISKDMALMIMLALKAVLITMLTLGTPMLIGLYAFLLAKMMLGLKTIATTNAFTLGVLSTKYLQQKKTAAQSVQQAASLLPFYAPLLLSSLLSSASLITGAVGLIGSLFSNSTTNSTMNNNGTTGGGGSNSSTNNTNNTEARRRIELLQLPLLSDVGGIEPSRLKSRDEDSPKGNDLSYMVKRATKTVKKFWRQFTRKIKIVLL